MRSYDKSFAVVAKVKRFVADEVLVAAEADGDKRLAAGEEVTIGKILIERGAIDASKIEQVEAVMRNHGLECTACAAITYLLPRQDEKALRCEKCGGATRRPVAKPASAPAAAAPAPAPAAAAPVTVGAGRPATGRVARPDAGPADAPSAAPARATGRVSRPEASAAAPASPAAASTAPASSAPAPAAPAPARATGRAARSAELSASSAASPRAKASGRFSPPDTRSQAPEPAKTDAAPAEPAKPPSFGPGFASMAPAVPMPEEEKTLFEKVDAIPRPVWPALAVLCLIIGFTALKTTMRYLNWSTDIGLEVMNLNVRKAVVKEHAIRVLGKDGYVVKPEEIQLCAFQDLRKDAGVYAFVTIKSESGIHMQLQQRLKKEEALEYALASGFEWIKNDRTKLWPDSNNSFRMIRIMFGLSGALFFAFLTFKLGLSR